MKYVDRVVVWRSEICNMEKMRGIRLFKSAVLLSICLAVLTLVHMNQQWKIEKRRERMKIQGGVDFGLLEKSDRVINKDYSDTRNKTIFFKQQVKQFFRIKQERVNAHNYDFVISNDNFCNGKVPFLLMLCLSKFSDITTRDVIRRTWASSISSGRWPLSDEKIENISLIFVLGRPDTSDLLIDDEIKTHNDIIMIDFYDSYDNLTTKVLMGLKWVRRYCPKTRYLLKVDQDTFIHLPNLVNYLKNLTLPERGLLAGRVNSKAEVFRHGRWALSWEQFPFDFYPPYLSGNSYVISGNIISRMIETAERMPYLKIEDVFFTGIIRRMIGAEIHNRPGFTYFNQSSPRLCGFHNNLRISATGTDDTLKIKLWSALHMNLTNCYMPPVKRRPELPV